MFSFYSLIFNTFEYYFILNQLLISKMRIITGKFKGRKLAEFKLKNTQNLRPTSEKSRSALFNILINSPILKGYGFKLENATIFDGFCGTGAIGFEALSRNAKFVTFADSSQKHLTIAKQNSDLLNIQDNAEFLSVNLEKALQKTQRDYDLIFLDPPYKNSIFKNTLDNLLNAGYIKENTVIVIEYGKRNKYEITEKFKSIDSRKYGKTIFEFLVLNVTKL
jgi:16S rRNA (guanine966-N2)-methyltransferase